MITLLAMGKNYCGSVAWDGRLSYWILIRGQTLVLPEAKHLFRVASVA